MTRWAYAAVVVAVAGLIAGVAPVPVSGQPQGQPAPGTGTPPRADRESRVTRRVVVADGPGGRLGVSLREVEAADASRAKLPEATGAVVDDVQRNSPADKAGLKAGDIVVEFDGERVRSAQQLKRLVRETPAGRTVKATVVREGTRHAVSVAPESTADWARDLADDVRAKVDRSLRRLPRRFDFNFDFDDLVPPDAPRAPAPPRAPRFEARPGAARLGVSVQPLTEQLATYFGAKQGALVSSVNERSAASNAGLKAGDVITTVDGQTVEDAGDLIRALRQAEGRDVSIGIVRDRKPMTLKATIGSPRP